LPQPGSGVADAAERTASPGGRVTSSGDPRDPREVTDETLMVRFQRGDRAAFASLVRRHQAPLYNFAFRHLRVQAVAEDVVQDAFVRVVQNAAEFKHEARFTTWLYTITRNLCIDQLRKRALRKHPSLDEAKPGKHGEEGDGPTLGEQTADTRASVEREATGTELKVRIAQAVETLPEEQREVFLLREVANLPFKEIASVTGVPENTVKSRMRYALERLQQTLSEYEEYARALR
jgi:RNA polymerase sigma-70 factor (ECF subfamily)